MARSVNYARTCTCMLGYCLVVFESHRAFVSPRGFQLLRLGTEKLPKFRVILICCIYQIWSNSKSELRYNSQFFSHVWCNKLATLYESASLHVMNILFFRRHYQHIKYHWGSSGGKFFMLLFIPQQCVWS